MKQVLLLLGLVYVAFCGMRSIPMNHDFLPEGHHLHGHFANRRGEASNQPENFQMGGNIYPVGIYWVSVDLGTPGQSMLVAVDSGSSDLLVPSASCEGCHLQNTGSFNETESSTLQPIMCYGSDINCFKPCSLSPQCGFSNTYQTCNLTDLSQPCTVTGNLWSDTYAQGDLTATVDFGLIDKQTQNFQQFFVIDGVLGMSFPALSSWGGSPPFQKLVEAGEVDNIFSMCMKPTAGGVLTLGGIDESLMNGPPLYTPMLKYHGEYVAFVMDVTDITVNGISTGLNPFAYKRYGSLGGCILDSGTNTILFPDPIYQPWADSFINYFDDMCASNTAPEGVCDGSLMNGECFKYTQEERDNFPTVDFILNELSLSMDGPDYIVANSTNNDPFYCLGVFNTGTNGNFIVGDALMQSYYVVFDMINHQIGWAPADLDNCIGLQETIYYD